jgi:XRE family transcriptional regulator, regulator of sulfur utilization
MSDASSFAPPDEPDPALGRVVRQLREARRVSRAALAVRSGLDEATLAEIEAGTVDPPWTAVEAIAGALEVSLRSIAGAVADQRPDQ